MSGRGHGSHLGFLLGLAALFLVGLRLDEVWRALAGIVLVLAGLYYVTVAIALLPRGARRDSAVSPTTWRSVALVLAVAALLLGAGAALAF